MFVVGDNLIESVWLNGDSNTILRSCNDQPLDDPAALLLYGPTDGTLTLATNGPSLTSIEITSRGGLFTGEPFPGVFENRFDRFEPHRLFRIKAAGMSFVEFGPVLESGLTVSELEEDFRIHGSFRPSGMYELLTGRPPSHGESELEILRQVSDGRISTSSKIGANHSCRSGGDLPKVLGA